MRQQTVRPAVILVLLVLALALASCARQDQTGGATPSPVPWIDTEPTIQALETRVADLEGRHQQIVIHIKGQKITRVVPPEKFVCKTPKANCGPQVEWILVGKVDPAWQVIVVEKANSTNKNCFTSPPVGTGTPTPTLPTFVLSDSQRRVASGPNACTTTGDEWGYDVFLMNGGTQLDKKDPLVVVDWS